MASPQIENGHIDIATSIVDKFCSYRLSGQEWQIVWVILRKTWGWLENPKDKNSSKKKMDRISLSQFEKLSGIDRRKCHELLKKLISKKLIKKTVTQKGDKTNISYGFQKDFDRWILSPKKGTVTHIGDRVSPKRVTNLSPKKVNTIDTLKETITKETFTSDSIEYRLANYLLKFILKRNPNHKKPNIQSWSKQIDLMLRIDKRHPDDIKAVIEWCQNDTPEKQPEGNWKGWANNILSTAKLREKFDQLYLKVQDKQQNRHKLHPITEHNIRIASNFLEKEGERHDRQ